MTIVSCANGGANVNRAPVEDRGTSAQRPIGQQVNLPAGQGAGGALAPAPMGIENAGKPGYYTVKPGDRLISIGLDHGQNWRDIARWNGITEPNRIEVGSVLRVVPPEGSAVVVTPVPSPPGSSSNTKPSTSTSAVSSSGAAVASATPAAPAAAPGQRSAEEGLSWLWPTQSVTVTQGFDGAQNKGIDIAGKAGDAVLAASDGRVVFTGNYPGYGKLVIIKHNDVYFSAYAHNRTIVVKEEQVVSKGQKIAEMGDTESDRVKLHFEIRRQGKPVDPTRYVAANK